MRRARDDAWLFLFFFISGFCSLVYEVVWLRLGMARFGVGTPLVSIILSVFMAGLALGSWGAGRLRRGRGAAAALGLYAVAEIIIGVFGLAVPTLFDLGRGFMNITSGGRTWGSGGYYIASGVWITLTLLPACACMGATIPLGMAAIRSFGRSGSQRSFSFLYLANVLGALAGTLLAALVLIETLGLRGATRAAAGLNLLVAAMALGVGFSIDRFRSSNRPTGAPAAAPVGNDAASDTGTGGRGILLFLFGTGLTSMGMEVVWVRQFTPLLGPVVYTFATLLATYLAATFAGTALYRAVRRRSPAPAAGVRGRDREPARQGLSGDSGRLALLCAALAISGLLPLVGADPRLSLDRAFLPVLLRVSLSVAPFCGLLGYVTPLFIDRLSAGNPRKAGAAYAANVLGCIAGPLLAGFVLLPNMTERRALLALGLPLLAFAFALLLRRRRRHLIDTVDALTIVAAVALPMLILSQTREPGGGSGPHEVRRDYSATVVAAGEGFGKRLLVNGIGMTNLTPIAKMMAHLPLVLRERPAARTVVICMGMGTTFRSALSWGIPTTVVELLPSVPKLFGFFHADGPDLVRRPTARVVIDDGRRFLERTPTVYDVVTLDPPPPLESAGSSLLYSRELYALASRRMSPDGILQQWLPGGEPAIEAAVAAAIRDSFPHVRVFRSVEGWGYHLLASRAPIRIDSGARLAARLPEAARADLLEWGPAADAGYQLDLVLQNELSIDVLTDRSPGMPPITDDRPFNEYYFLRRLASGFRVASGPW